MAISISKYIGISNRASNDVIGERDWSALVFSKVAMKTGASGQKATDYSAKKVVSLSADDVSEYFDDSEYKAFLGSLFSYNGGTKRVAKVNVVLVGNDESALDAYDRVVAEFYNFGAFTFYGDTFEVGDAGDEGLLDVAIKNSGNEYGWVMVVKTTKTDMAADGAALTGMTLTHLTLNQAEPLAWYPTCNYNAIGSSGTIDFKQFPGSVATIDSDSDKDSADAAKVNYVGKVQNYGTGLKFYQTGVNTDGTDLGVVRDMCWINHGIVQGYFDLQNNVQKVPADGVGCSMVRTVIIGVAKRAISNGCILINKPLTDDQKATILSFTGNDNAANTIQITGYYIDVKMVKDGGRYVCQYTLVYAKGDHIAKVDGAHILV